MGSHGGRDRSRRESNGMLDVLADGGAGGKMVRLVVVMVRTRRILITGYMLKNKN